MNRTLKRVLGLTGSVALGIAGAVTFASAAQAHHVEIEGITECTPDGGWTVVWQVTDWNSDNGSVGTITAVDAELNEGSEIAVDAVLPHPTSGNYLEGSQNFASDVTEASIKVNAKWDNGATRQRAGQGLRSRGRLRRGAPGRAGARVRRRRLDATASASTSEAEQLQR